MHIGSLPKATQKGKRRLGQGHGSGRVKTAGRGTKGQQARRTIPLDFEGGALPLRKRIPMLRGKGKLFSFNEEAIVVPLAALNRLKTGATVDAKTLVSAGIIKEKHTRHPLKILGKDEVTVALTVTLPVSKQAREAIERAGGTVVTE
jgi:large subunit ribosomal protein L15